MPEDPPPTGRLAPTPSGHLHLGNVCAFAAAWLSVRARGGTLLLRVEDLDRGRYRAEVEHSQRADLAWLGIDFDRETERQSTRSYDRWLERLGADSYFCRCSRADVRRVGGAYPGTCRDLGLADGALRWRVAAGAVNVRDQRCGAHSFDPAAGGDPVLRRRDGTVTYNLAVVVDDIRDGVTEVARGADLLEHSALQTRLFEALSHAAPTWLHAPLVVGPDGRKLSKSHGSMHIAAMRSGGWSAAEIWRLVLPWLGIEGCDSLAAALKAGFDVRRGPRGPIVLEYDTTVACPAPGQVRTATETTTSTTLYHVDHERA